MAGQEDADFCTSGFASGTIIFAIGEFVKPFFKIFLDIGEFQCYFRIANNKGVRIINTRLKSLRIDRGLNQQEFAAKIGVTDSAVSRWELGTREIPAIAIQSICREFGVREEWLREGTGEMYATLSREEEMGRLVRRLLSGSPASFQSALVMTLLRFDPDGPEWQIVEKIYNDLAAELEKGREP